MGNDLSKIKERLAAGYWEQWELDILTEAELNELVAETAVRWVTNKCGNCADEILEKQLRPMATLWLESRRQRP